MLEDEGIVMRVRSAERNSFEYQLTTAGEQLKTVVLALGHWATEWQYEKFKDDTIHVDALMRDLELTLVAGAMPGSRSVLKFLFDDVAQGNRWYVVVDAERIEACDEDRAFEVDVYLSASPRTVADILLKKIPLAAAMRDGRLKVTGSKAHIQSISKWFGLAPYVDAEAARMLLQQPLD